MPNERAVLLHGFLGSDSSYEDVLMQLNLEQAPLCPALYGHNGAPDLPPSHDFESEVTRLEQTIESYAGETPVHLAGYSLGARLALALLVRAPRLFHSATLVSGRRGLDSPEERSQRLETDQSWATQLRSRSLAEFLSEWETQPLFFPMQQLAPKTLARLRRERLRHDPQSLARALLALSLARMPTFGADLPQIAVPVTLLAGSLDPKFVVLGKELASRVPNAKFNVVDGAGHSLLIERPDAVAAAIRQGLNHAQRYVETSPNL